VAWNLGESVQNQADIVMANLEETKQRINNIKLEAMEVDKRVIKLEWGLTNTQQWDIGILMSEWMQMAHNWELLWDMVLDQNALIIKMRNMIEELQVFQVAVQHGPGNPIMVDNQEDDERTDVDEEEDNFTNYFNHPVVPVEGVLQEIDDDKNDQPPAYIQ